MQLQVQIVLDNCQKLTEIKAGGMFTVKYTQLTVYWLHQDQTNAIQQTCNKSSWL